MRQPSRKIRSASFQTSTILCFLIFLWSHFNNIRSTENFETHELFNITRLENNTGIFNKKIGTINLYNDHWKFILFLEFRDVQLQYKSIQYYYSQINAICVAFKIPRLKLQNVNDFSVPSIARMLTSMNKLKYYPTLSAKNMP